MTRDRHDAGPHPGIREGRAEQGEIVTDANPRMRVSRDPSTKTDAERSRAGLGLALGLGSILATFALIFILINAPSQMPLVAAIFLVLIAGGAIGLYMMVRNNSRHSRVEGPPRRGVL